MRSVGQAQGKERHDRRASASAESLLKPAKTAFKKTGGGKAFGKAMRSLPSFQKWSRKYLEGEDPKSKSRVTSAVAIFRSFGDGSVDRETTLKRIEALADRAFRAVVLYEGQSPLREAIPPEILEFMPKNIVVKVDEDGRIEEIADVFANERENLAVKIDKMKRLLTQYNDIARQVKEDLKSPDEVTRLSALITAIIMETGIRPGSEGSRTIKVLDGREVPIETFGAVTLGPRHVSFIRDNFAEIRFIGKKGTENVAQLSDEDIVSELRALAAESSSDRLFVTKDGRPISYEDLARYFKRRFRGITPTDFRKLKATRVVFDELANQREALKEDIERIAESETEDLRQRVVERVVDSLNAAVEKSQDRLSHVSPKTTRDSYINPEILLDFLSRGEIAESLEDAVLSGDKYLVFDVEKFTARPLVANPAQALALKGILLALD